MANRATVTYNGNAISTEDREGSFAVTYNGSTLATLGAGQSKTLNCFGQAMKTDIAVGGKNLRCKNLKMYSDVVVSVVSLFPSEPSAYRLIASYTASQTWTAPEDGYFQIEVFGASGSGAESLTTSSSKYYYRYGGGGGGGGGYACSRIKMNKGDTVVLTVGAVGATTLAVINSSLESYATMQITSGANGTVPYKETSISPVVYGFGGEGGVASGGNYANANGGKGGDGGQSSDKKTEAGINPAPGGVGGVAGHADGNVGGHGATTREDGSAGFIKIYRGNTNIA